MSEPAPGEPSLYARLGGYDAIAAVCDALLTRLKADAQLARFWRDRALDSVRREQQHLVDFLCSCAGGPVYYMGRDMATAHRGIGISAADWNLFLGHLKAILDHFQVPPREYGEVTAFVDSLRKDCVEKA